MNAETGAEAESPKKRGRIPQSAWPQILERYRGGATLSAIAREFECTPSAISYIIRKAEAANVQGELSMEDGPAAEPAPVEAEPVAAAPEAPAAAAVAPAEPAKTEAAEAPAPAPAPAKAPAARSAEGRPVRQRLTTRSAAEQPAAPAPAPTAQAPAQTPAQAPTQVAAPASTPAQPAQTETLRLNRPDPQPAPQPAPVAPPAPAPAAVGEAAAARPAGARPEPTPPVDAVEGRLRDTAKACISAYRSWRQQPSESSIQSLSDTVHELRKALARIEIDMSASRREEQAIRPIPIPAHRASRRPQ